MNKEQLILSIGQLKGFSDESAAREQLKEDTSSYLESQIHDWKQSLVCRSLMVGVFGPIGLAVFQLAPKGIGHRGNLIPFFPAWVLLVFLVITLVCGWLFNKVKPRFGNNELGMLYECTRCQYDLRSHDSVLGDSIWVGPEKCPECGQEYPSIPN